MKQEFAALNRAYWGKRAEGYSKVNQEELATGQRRVWGQELAQAIARQWPGRPAQEICVLDVGTGPGFFAIVLAELGYRVTAVDATPEMLAQAKGNAGPLASRIRFVSMDAQALAFDEGVFDVVVSRNVTWNLHRPERAYGEWVRVLRPGGLLLNFDANWYRYLFDDQAQAAHRRDRENVTLEGVEDDTAGTDVTAMEAIARRAPLSSQLRPEWDEQVLSALGMGVEIDCQAWRRLWTRCERVNNASTPMFRVMGVKQR